MSRLDFHFEFYNEVTSLDPILEAEAESRMRELASGETDVTGASVSVEELTGEETPHFFQGRVVVYMRPDNVVAVEKAETLELALRGALKVAEQRVRERRETLRKPWQQPRKITEMNVYESTPRELYDAFAYETDPKDLVNLNRTNIATRLMTEEQLDQETAYYAADQILVYTDEMDAT